jgi:hypothetical protein
MQPALLSSSKIFSSSGFIYFKNKASYLLSSYSPVLLLSSDYICFWQVPTMSDILLSVSLDLPGLILFQINEIIICGLLGLDYFT